MSAKKRKHQGILRRRSDDARILNLLLFVVLTLLIHFGYRWWAYEADYTLFGIRLMRMETLEWMGRQVFLHALWVVRDLFGVEVEVAGQIIYMPGGGGVAVDGSCSGLKQMLQFALLILPLPGPWRHKAWFIPAGILMVHLTNVLRVSGLCWVMLKDPSLFDFFHDYVFRGLFYIVIFAMWLAWTEWLRPGR